MQPSQSSHEHENPDSEGLELDLVDNSSESLPSERTSRFYDLSDEVRLRAGLSVAIPIELEIGSGKGLFLTNAAQKNPSRQFIGMELATKYARESQARLERLKISNACFIACDAVAVMNQDIADNSIQTIHVYFPDPWWKSRHKKRRVLSDQTLRNIERTLKPNGELQFWTDVLDYYEDTLAHIDSVTSLIGPFYVPEPESHHDMDFRTHFERRTRRNGLPVYRARFNKPA